LPAISREVDAMIEAKAGKITAEVTSAVDLDPQQLAQITQTLERLSGKKVTIEKKKDPALLGGVVAKVGDVVYDGSVRAQLRALRDELGK
jgi:F-type H+-transporting ATPase subunit delta